MNDDTTQSFFCPHRNKRVNEAESTARRIIRGVMSMLANEGAVYYPEELALLGRVFDGASESLPANMRTASNRALIARNILACATGGERDPVKLRLAALGPLQIAIAA